MYSFTYVFPITTTEIRKTLKKQKDSKNEKSPKRVTKENSQKCL